MFSHSLTFIKTLAMKSKTISRRLEGAGCFELLHDDVLRLILMEVSLENANDLFNIVNVSKRLYALATPYIYRDTTLDLARSSHQRLLQRLIRPGAQLPRAIRILKIRGVATQTAVPFLDLYVFFSRLTNIHELHWDGTLSIPHCLLEIIAHRHPTAQIYLDAGIIKLGDVNTTPTLAYTVFAYPAGAQLREFNYTPTDRAQLYDDFKLHLIQMLKLCHTLQALTINWTRDEDRSFPELLTELCKGPFTKLRELRLLTPANNGVSLLTASEVSLLSTHGCWEQLETLSLEHVPLLPHFLSTRSRLSKLWLYRVDQASWNNIELWLDEHNLFFENLTDIQFFGIAANGSNAVESMVPWALVKRAPNITILKIYRAYFDTSIGPATNAPTSDDISQLRACCPGLTFVSFDIEVRGKWPTWKYDVLDELARFNKAIEVELYVHMDLTLSREIGLNRFNCHKAFKHILNQRRRLGLPCNGKFQIGFKVARPFGKMKGDDTVPDYNFYLNDSGKIRLWRQRTHKKREELDLMSMEDLIEKESLSRASMVVWDRKGYKAEIQRRARNDEAATGFSRDAMLYDLLV